MSLDSEINLSTAEQITRRLVCYTILRVCDILLQRSNDQAARRHLTNPINCHNLTQRILPKLNTKLPIDINNKKARVHHSFNRSGPQSRVKRPSPARFQENAYSRGLRIQGTTQTNDEWMVHISFRDRQNGRQRVRIIVSWQLKTWVWGNVRCTIAPFWSFCPI